MSRYDRSTLIILPKIIHRSKGRKVLHSTGEELAGRRYAGINTCPYRAFYSIHKLCDAGVPLTAIEMLADADAFRSIGLDRRQALWKVTALAGRPTGIFTGQVTETVTEQQIQLPVMTLSEHVIQDYAATILSLKAHPVSFIRDKLRALRILSTKDLDRCQNGTMLRVAGLVLVRQRPGTAAGVCFITIEDETSFASLVVFQNLFEQYRKEILHLRVLMVEGKLQREGMVTHVIVQRCFDLSGLLRNLTEVAIDNIPVQTLSRANEKDGDALSPQEKKVHSYGRRLYKEKYFQQGEISSSDHVINILR